MEVGEDGGDSDSTCRARGSRFLVEVELRSTE